MRLVFTCLVFLIALAFALTPTSAFANQLFHAPQQQESFKNNPEYRRGVLGHRPQNSGNVIRAKVNLLRLKIGARLGKLREGSVHEITQDRVHSNGQFTKTVREYRIEEGIPRLKSTTTHWIGKPTTSARIGARGFFFNKRSNLREFRGFAPTDESEYKGEYKDRYTYDRESDIAYKTEVYLHDENRFVTTEYDRTNGKVNEKTILPDGSKVTYHFDYRDNLWEREHVDSYDKRVVQKFTYKNVSEGLLHSKLELSQVKTTTYESPQDKEGETKIRSSTENWEELWPEQAEDNKQSQRKQFYASPIKY